MVALPEAPDGEVAPHDLGAVARQVLTVSLGGTEVSSGLKRPENREAMICFPSKGGRGYNKSL